MINYRIHSPKHTAICRSCLILASWLARPPPYLNGPLRVLQKRNRSTRTLALLSFPYKTSFTPVNKLARSITHTHTHILSLSLTQNIDKDLHAVLTAREREGLGRKRGTASGERKEARGYTILTHAATRAHTFTTLAFQDGEREQQRARALQPSSRQQSVVV